MLYSVLPALSIILNLILSREAFKSLRSGKEKNDRKHKADTRYDWYTVLWKRAKSGKKKYTTI